MASVSYPCELGLSALQIVQHALQIVQPAAHYIQACLWLGNIAGDVIHFCKTVCCLCHKTSCAICLLISFKSAASDIRLCTLVPSHCFFNAPVGYRFIGCECEQLDFEPMAYQAPADSIHAVQRSRLL